MDAKILDYLPTVLNRNPSREELCLAADMSIATYDRRKTQGFALEEVLKMLDYYGLSRPEALIALGVIDIEDTMDAVGMSGAVVDLTATVDLAEEVARRLREDAGEPGDETDNTVSRFPVTQALRRPTRRVSKRAKPRKEELRKGLLE